MKTKQFVIITMRFALFGLSFAAGCSELGFAMFNS